MEPTARRQNLIPTEVMKPFRSSGTSEIALCAHLISSPYWKTRKSIVLLSFAVVEDWGRIG
jgi:hypothetical protein